MLSFEGVDRVAGPDPVGAREDAEVDPTAAGGAGLDLETVPTPLTPWGKTVPNRLTHVGNDVKYLGLPASISAIFFGVHDVVSASLPANAQSALCKEGVKSTSIYHYGHYDSVRFRQPLERVSYKHHHKWYTDTHDSNSQFDATASRDGE